MYDSLNGKIALVTGGTKGIGRSIADKLSANGVTVVITARSKSEDDYNNYHFIAADLTRADSAGRIAKEVLEKYGKIDIVVNNAGANLSPGGGFNTLEDEDWFKDWELNFMSVVRMNKALLPAMLEQKEGIIINISTGAAKQPIWEMTMSYSSAKAALNAYSKALANEVGSKGIRVNTVSPGVVRTPLMNDFIENIAQQSGTTFEESFQSIVDKVGVPIGRMAEPEEIANMVAFLASSEGQYITGANISVDGGASPTV
ncbi:SDR family oxidoreductase [Epilithonimonas hungarica]|uniref:NAD(P)-dependent dehydrogenase, short-chain alcohol dehydrogenase family n=1 Tax=Epilithonimonas hungarica TaxID=454006 RepID=A0A1G7TUI7_9FLAO|nr:SDR family oxidoreductase [Epilithonimonas hungarica]SDG38389.1 NAD(P)-dependent dehydrogenase, short-chain alcohol dehydrogenase family [Epilithonimonas hungarica]